MDNEMGFQEHDDIIQREIGDTLKHWQRLLLMEYMDDLDEYLDNEHNRLMRSDLAERISCLLIYVLHGHDPWLDDREAPREGLQNGGQNIEEAMHVSQYRIFGNRFHKSQ